VAAFKGWPAEAFDFYEGLEADNSKTYWTEHKATYDEKVLAPMVDLLAELEDEFGPTKVFRPYRDVRFSADKSPYKTNLGAVLGSGYDAEGVEVRHRFKKDAPSGTAARLLEIILEERKLTAQALRHGREGITGERTNREVGIHALRGGDVVGEHTVMFAALGERLELTHKASDRGIFARGAVRAAQWVVGRAPGVYDMQDVLGLK